MTPILMATALAFALTQGTPSREVSFQGCVTPGLDRGTYVVTGVSQVTGPDAAEIPEVAHGRRILFWLDNDAAVRANTGRKVQIRGNFTGIEESEIEVKAGRQQAGGFVIEFEGPGKDVRTSDPSVSAAVGTAGRVSTDPDVKTYLMRINVRNVTVLENSCTPAL